MHLLLKPMQKLKPLQRVKASQNTLQAFGPLLPELLGGSADLAGSNQHFGKVAKAFKKIQR